jgi:hypothetical protein
MFKWIGSEVPMVILYMGTDPGSADEPHLIKHDGESGGIMPTRTGNPYTANACSPFILYAAYL